MSRLENLIAKYCPDGVKPISLGELEDAGYITLGRGDIISIAEINLFPGDYPVYSSSATGLGEFGRYGKYMFDDVRITWSVDGGGKFFYRHKHRYSVTNVSGWLKVNDIEQINEKFLYFSLITAWTQKTYDYVHKAHPSVIRREYSLQIPPLPIQKEIVRILDAFIELEAELEAELKARILQYEHYRNHLLTFKPLEAE